MCLGLPSIVFTSVVQNKILYAFNFSLVYFTFSECVTFTKLVNPAIFYGGKIIDTKVRYVSILAHIIAVP
jgi:hypothetical protein